MDPSSQAPCLCYSSTAWSPNGFDGPVKTCANFVSTADPSAFSDIAGIEGYCSSIGDIKNAGTAAGITSAGGGGIIGGGVGLTIPGISKTTTGGSTTSPATSPATTSKPTPQASVPTPVLTTSRPSDGSSRIPSSFCGLFIVAFSMVVLL